MRTNLYKMPALILLTAAATFTSGFLLGYEQGAKDHMTGNVMCSWQRDASGKPSGRIKCWQSQETPAFKAAKPAIITEERLWK